MSISEYIASEKVRKFMYYAHHWIDEPLPLSTKGGLVTLQTIERVREALGVNLNLGASNVSFGLPERHTINQAFLSLAIAAGATCAITDPMKLSLTIRAVDLLRGRDDYAARYIKHYRKLAAETES
jgi:5-methyltetrahydrofolate--homocysteine methyltransferase